MTGQRTFLESYFKTAATYFYTNISNLNFLSYIDIVHFIFWVQGEGFEMLWRFKLRHHLDKMSRLY